MLQAALGYVQYFTGTPPLLAGIHVLTAAVVFAVAAWAWLSTVGPATPGPAGARRREAELTAP